MENVLEKQAESIERCINRIHDVYYGHESEIERNVNIQEIIALNIQRAARAAIHMADDLVEQKQLGASKNGRESFQLLVKNRFIDDDLGDGLMKMASFRNVLIHNFDKVSVRKIKAVIADNLNDLTRFSSVVMGMK